MRGRLFLTIVLLLGICCSSFLPHVVYAEDSQNDYQIELSPASRRLSFKPGERKKDSLELKNSGAKAVTVDIYAVAYYTDDGNTTEDGDLSDVYTKMAEWIVFKDDDGEYRNKMSFIMYPNQTMKVNYAVDVPSDAAGGGQYAIIFAEFVPVKVTNEPVTLYAHSRVGMSLFAFVDSEGIERSTQIDNIIASNGILFNQKAGVVYTIANTGNIDFQTSTEVVVNSIFGKEIYHDITVETVLPGRTKPVSVKWDETPPIGIYRVNYTIDALDMKEEGSHLIFVLSSWVLCLLILIIIVAAIVIIYHRKKKMWRKRRANALRQQ